MSATRTPTDPVSVAVLTGFKAPYPTQLILYEEKNTTTWKARTIWLNKEGKDPNVLKAPTDWSFFAMGTPVTATILSEEKPNLAGFAFIPATQPADQDKIEYSQIPAGGPDPPKTSVLFRNKADGATESPGPKVTDTSPPKESEVPKVSSNSVLPPVSTSSASSSSSVDSVAPITTPGQNNGNNSDNIKNVGLSGGAVAGVAIGCLLAGILIAGVLAWFCLKRRKSATGVRDSEASTVGLMHREKGPVVKTMSVASGSPIATALENGLPQPLEDQAISGEISKISNLIKNHVQSYYHGRAVSPGLIDYDDIQALGENLPVSVGTLSTLLNNSATREIALRFCLAWVVTSRIQLNDTSNTTFLPPEVAKSIQSMNLDHGEQTSRVNALFFGKWRALTAELLQPTYVRSPFSAADGRIRNVKAAATLLDSVLRPFADSRMEDGARSRNLEEILKRSAQFAFTLFSQPTSWRFDWQDEGSVKSGSLCIFPALVQVADENGEPLHPPRPFSEPVIRGLDD